MCVDVHLEGEGTPRADFGIGYKGREGYCLCGQFSKCQLNVNFEVNLVHQGLKNNNKNIVLSLWSDCSEQLLLLDFENEKHIQLRLHMWTIFRLGESNFGTKAYGS